MRNENLRRVKKPAPLGPMIQARLGWMESWHRVASGVLSWNEDPFAEPQIDPPFKMAALTPSRLQNLLVFGFRVDHEAENLC